MNRFMTALAKPAARIAITATLIIAQGCAPSPKAEEKPVAATKQHQGHSMGGMQHGEQQPTTHGSQHEGHSTSKGGETPSLQAKLTVPKNIAANNPVPLVIDIQDSAGKAIASFDTFQEKLMHLIVVSDELQFFSHLHPTHQGNGRFEVEANFPQPGGYTIFSDYKPSGQKEQVSVLKTTVPGKTATPPAVDMNLTKTFAKTKVKLNFSEPTIKAGKEVMLVFKLQDTTTNQQVTDLQPYLGENGHLVIIRQSEKLTSSDYIHAHAHGATPAGEVHFMTQFPQPGKYKLWGQFNRNGQIVTADFWVNVL